MRVRTSLFGLILPTLLAAQQGPACGVDRWTVKILTDPDRDSVSVEVEPTTIAALVDLPMPRESRPARGRLAMEHRTFRVRGILVETRPQPDLDLHLVLVDPVERIVVGADPSDPTDVRVWLNLSSRVYHCPGSANYGTTSRGAYMPESAAVRAGGRPAGGRRCG